MTPRHVLIAGATGLVGRELLQGLLADASVQRVHSLGRRAPALAHAKLVPHIVDFAALPPLPACDEVYLALGTTIKVAGSQAALRAVDHDANLAVARAAQQAGARRAGLVSAMGASARSGVFYNRVKGELEDDLARLGFDALVIARPSLLVGDRSALGQPARPGERIGFAVGQALGFLVPANYRPIDAAKVAAALLAQVPRASGRRVLLSGEMQRGSA
ncbi:nucleoside-diphosphate sugar epimerase [Aquabacterium sp.]|uniref:nucleoside-diphosphate sugar epimerase n=1 Tax=Aquabacterium sp. TaxID=1872578 RepID=UPI003784A65C